ncbi:Mu transposase C-terminal domain-containing protein [Janibacter sp. UYMM211]|uniref:Mu transposase C-terminal domain-containing protein n=1 Tax=Janibacter sp. UYMM211 TaxID=3156342 RepID=UPI0033968D7B
MTVTPGAMVTFEGSPARVVSFGRNSEQRLEVLIDTGDGLRRIPTTQFFATLADRPPEPVGASETGSPLLQQLPAQERQRIEDRYRDLLQIRTGSRRGDADGDRERGALSRSYDPEHTTLTERLNLKSRELRDREIPASSVVQLRRQLRAVERDGIEALIHGNRRVGPQRISNVDDEVLEIIGKVLADQPARARLSVKALMTTARAALIHAGIGEDISQYKLRDIVNELSRSLDLHLDAKGRERVAMKPADAYRRRLVSRPGEIVQIDATTTNLHVWAPGVGWQRSTILTAVDVFTRCVLALRVVTGSATSRDVAMLLWDIGRPTITRSGYPYELVHHHGMPTLIVPVLDPDEDPPHPVLGTKPALIPSAIVVDHGREFDCEHLVSACARIDVDVVFCPPRAAHAKGVVESLHNSLREIQSLLAAYKGADVSNHPKGVEDLAALTAQDLRDALWDYILEIYHWQEHRGLTALHDSATPLCPAGVFEAYLESGGEVTVPTDPYRLIQLLSSKSCTVNAYGVNIEGRVYNNATLVALRTHLARGVSGPARRLLVFYDRWDVSRVYTRHPITGEWLCIPRAGDTTDAQMPCSDMFDKAIRTQVIRGDHRPLRPNDAATARAQFVNRWAPERLTDRNEARIRAIEDSRQHDYAHDLQDAPPEFRRLAFGDEPARDGLTARVVPATADSDDILDADLDERDEAVDLDDLEEFDPDTDTSTGRAP